MHRAKQASKQTNKAPACRRLPQRSTASPAAMRAERTPAQSTGHLAAAVTILPCGRPFLRRSASGRAPEAVAALHCARPIAVAARRILLNVHKSEFGSLSNARVVGSCSATRRNTSQFCVRHSTRSAYPPLPSLPRSPPARPLALPPAFLPSPCSLAPLPPALPPLPPAGAVPSCGGWWSHSRSFALGCSLDPTDASPRRTSARHSGGAP